MGKCIIIAGDTGSGKSRSIKNLPPDETFVINVLNKPLPFAGSVAKYNKKEGNMLCVTGHDEVRNAILDVSQKKPGVKYLVVDDIGFVMTSEFFARSAETGYSKFSDFGAHMQQIIAAAKNSRDDLHVALMFHDDYDYSDKNRVNRKLKTIGQLLDEKYNPLAVVSVALFSDVIFNKDNQPEYTFLTNRSLIDKVIVPAKSPEGMFEEGRIPNDLAYVFQKVDEYYGILEPAN